MADLGDGNGWEAQIIGHSPALAGARTLKSLRVWR